MLIINNLINIMHKVIRSRYFLLIIISFINSFFYENTMAQNNLDFKSFATDFIKNVPKSKEYFLDNSEKYIKSIEYEESILEVPHLASEEYDWVKGYFENSIYTTNGDSIICFYIDDKEVLNRLNNIPQNNLTFKNDGGYIRFIGYLDETGNYIKDEDSYPTIIGNYVCSFKFIKEIDGNWKLNIIDTGGE